MKKFLCFVLLVCAVVTVACDKVDDLLTFYIDEDETIQINSGWPMGQLVPVVPVQITTNSEERFKNNNTRAELVKDVILNKLKLTITEPQGSNFNFLKSITLYIKNDDKGETKLAYLDPVPDNLTEIELKSTNAKLDDYIKGNEYSIRTEAVLDQSVTRDITIKADMRFKVTADPL